MTIDLKGHAALITGSTQGIGRAIAEAYADAGADVVIHGLEGGADADAVLERCRAAGVQASFVAGDLAGSTEAAVEHLFKAAIAAQPKLDILVNNAGHHYDKPFLEMTHDRFEKTMRLNIASGYFLAQAFARRWVEQGTRGRMVFLGSINGRLAEADSTAYDTSKGAVEMMVRSLCVALAPHGIRVNGLAPGLIHTPQTAVWLDTQPERARWLAYHSPNGVIPDAKACGGAAVFLASDAAEHVHGHMLAVDGGMSAWQHPNPPTK